MATEPYIAFSLRLPAKLQPALDDRANRNRRSRSQEILMILERALIGGSDTDQAAAETSQESTAANA